MRAISVILAGFVMVVALAGCRATLRSGSDNTGRTRIVQTELEPISGSVVIRGSDNESEANK